ncbi:hypothetical protein MMC19_006257 [Ptychographa xylographoides]|nr:hypothetical protein [Ptychographa xylographoides]
MATTTGQDTGAFNTKEYNSSGDSADHAAITRHMTHDEHETAKKAARFGYGPLAQINTSDSTRLPAFGGEFQPGTYAAVEGRKFANPAPLGLSAFALTTFVLSLINMGTRGVAGPNIVVAIAFGYGGLVQLLAGMWEMAVGNTFGATALSSYGGFWIAFGIILTPGGFDIQASLTSADGSAAEFLDSFGFFLMGWFIFTTMLLIATLRSTVAFFLLFFTLDMAFLLLGIGYLNRDAAGAPNPPIIIAGGVFGILAAFLAWYNALAGILDTSNSFFIIPVAHFPWSVTGKERRSKQKAERANV